MTDGNRTFDRSPRVLYCMFDFVLKHEKNERSQTFFDGTRLKESAPTSFSPDESFDLRSLKAFKALYVDCISTGHNANGTQDLRHVVPVDGLRVMLHTH